MPSRTDYLAAVGANAGSSAERIHTLVNQCPTVAAADTMLRKLASKGLLTTENTSPRTYLLTDKGKAELASSAESQAGTGGFPTGQNQHAPISNRVQRVRALLDRLRALEANGSMNFGQRSEEQTRAEIKPCVLELLAFERASSDLPRRNLQEHKELLCQRIGDEDIVQKITRLAKAEAELCEQKGWWGDEDEAQHLEIEIAELKDQLGLPKVAVSSTE